jgi:type IV pilus assembly protein PilB
MGFLRKDQFDEVRRIARETGETDVAKILVSLNIVGEREVLQSRAQLMGYAFADISRVSLDPSAIASVPATLARSCRALPLKRDGTNLWVAMLDPTDARTANALKLASGCRIIPVFAIPGEVEEAVRRAYPEDAGSLGTGPTPS